MDNQRLLEALLGLLRSPSPSSLPPGMTERGNIDISNRPSVPNPEGGHSTVLSMGVGDDRGENLIPRVVDNQILSSKDAIQAYLRSGKHLGRFEDVPSSDSYAQDLHLDQEAGQFGNRTITPRSENTVQNLLMKLLR